ncbi:MAG: DUF5117 domain-containing protein [Rhodothermales bacterium]|nr:DUF5117 domain-containing protein [Rhodothermales bacterium]
MYTAGKAITRPVALALVLMMIQGCTTVNVTPDGNATAAKSGSQASAESQAAKSDKPKSPFKPWDEVLKDTRKVEGYFSTHVKRDNTVFIEIKPGQLAHDFGMVMHYSKGVGVFNVHDGLPLSGMMLMQFKREGDTVYLVHQNPRFIADTGSPMKVSLDDNVGHSIVDSFTIATEDTTSKSIVIDATSLFVSDYPGVASRLRPYYGNRPVQFDKSRSFVDDVMGFPENVEVDVQLTFKSDTAPTTGRAGVSDVRSIPVGVRYSIVKLPEVPMMPRLADDRVGTFLDAVRDFSRDQEETPYLRYVKRWRLEKKDPGAAMSEPVKPITYYVDHSVPEAYRKYVKEGIEAWGKAFEAAGFKNAIVAADAPDDSTWSAEDVRYSTVRWTAAYQMGYAIGPSQSDPRTGEILNADVLISSTFVSGWNNEYSRMVGENSLIEQFDKSNDLSNLLDSETAMNMCMAEIGKSHELGLQYAAMLALGTIDKQGKMPEEYLGDAIRDLIMHEVGHTLGMRHNFKGSSAIPFAKLNDTSFTSANGLSLSVMDYAPTNISSDVKKQGHYVNMNVGPYDIWAIRYAYEPMYVTGSETNGDSGLMSRLAKTPDEELAGLRAIASQAADPLHVYNTDEDTHRGPMAVDPLSNTWDLSGSPIAYARDRVALVERIQPELEARLIEDGQGYQQLRGAVNRLLFERYRALIPVTKTIGGIDFVRHHKNDPSGDLPFTPVSSDRQREALQLIIDESLVEGSFPVSGDMLNKMAPNRYSDWANSTNYSGSIDFPIHGVVLSMQAGLLTQIIDNGKLARIIDNEVRMPGGGDAFTIEELFSALSGAIFSEIDGRARNADTFRRNLQRYYLTLLGNVVMDVRPRPTTPPAPEDARSLARLELIEIDSKMDNALAGEGISRTMRAHLLESRARIESMLDQGMTRIVK